MFFASDNWAGAAPQILEALTQVNAGPAPAYGDDEVTKRASTRVAEIFETECTVYFVTSGSAANGLGLATLCPPYGSVLCYEASHIHLDECACPEFYTAGAKLLPLPAWDGKLTPEIVNGFLERLPQHPPHLAPPSVLALTQATECGTVYSVDELKALSALARKAGLKVQMDGARFANAVISTGASPAELTWKAGVDVLSFGGTKNGCLAAEAVILFDGAAAEEFEYRRKRGGHLWSKMRFLSAQFEAYLTNGLWLELAAHANEMAKRLSDGLARIDGVEIVWPTQANEVFATFPEDLATRLRNQGAVFHPWIIPGDPAGGRMVRLIASFQTQAEEVDHLLELASGP